MSIPDYIAGRIRQNAPASLPVLKGSTPVVAFGDVRRARVATLGLNPSKREFVENGKELTGRKLRLQTVASLGERNLARASHAAVNKVFEWCNSYFERDGNDKFKHNPYWRWFGRLEKILAHVGASYIDGSACHLDLVQWATDPAWGKPGFKIRDKKKLLEADREFLRKQLAHEHIELLLLNGRTVVDEYREHVDSLMPEVPVFRQGRIELFCRCASGSLMVLGWNLNVQTNRASDKELDLIGRKIVEAIALDRGKARRLFRFR